MSNTIRVGFLGAGGFARAHAYALDALKYYYADAPQIEKVVVASPTPARREAFAERFGFETSLPPEAIWERDDLDALFILGPNHTHTPQLIRAAAQLNLKRIYIEKPVSISGEELNALESLDASKHGKSIMVGFEFLQKAALRKALRQWRTGEFGAPIHFRAEYLHSGYLDPEYRRKKQNRFEPIPVDGAMVDLGTHVLSLLTAFLGNTLQVKSALSSGHFSDVPTETDLCTTVLLEEMTSGAAGTLVASRVSAGTGDQLSLELRGSRGALLFDSARPDCYETYLPDEGWQRHEVNSDYLPASGFSSPYVPAGWLRALVHNHYLFFGGESGISFIPDLAHGIRVQHLVNDIAEILREN
jgi:predicted dehydrogenase